MDYELYPTCESCFQENMIKCLFKNKMERIKELLELINTNIRGPFNNMVKEVFITSLPSLTIISIQVFVFNEIQI